LGERTSAFFIFISFHMHTYHWNWTIIEIYILCFLTTNGSKVTFFNSLLYIYFNPSCVCFFFLSIFTMIIVWRIVRELFILPLNKIECPVWRNHRLCALLWFKIYTYCIVSCYAIFKNIWRKMSEGEDPSSCGESNIFSCSS
jgi:hypothetical protein